MMKKKSPKIIFIITGLLILIGIVFSLIISPLRDRLLYADILKTQKELKDISQAVLKYDAVYGVYPTGSFSAIIDTLEGANPQKKIFLQWPDREDIWGQTYLVKSGTTSSPPSFYSSGPDKVDDECSPVSDDIELTYYKTPKH